MLRETDVFDAKGFAFVDFGEPKAPALVTVEQGAHGAAATIPDAHLLFNSDFTRSGNDLHLDGHNGERAIVRDYFGAGEPAALLSREGARLSPDLVEALTRSVAPHQVAQAAPAAPAASDAVGRVVTASPDSTILRNGVPVTVTAGDPVLRADVLQTASGAMAVTFNDGSTLNLTANTRIVVSEFIYSPSNTGNSQLLELVQGSLTFISGEVAHSGDMRIGTPVATMGIRGTVGGVTTASDGTVQFYVSQSATGAVIINQQGQIIANVVQDGPLIVVRPVGPLQVIADEIQKSPAQLAAELQALQQIVNIKAVGDQLLQQFFQQQQQQSPNPQSGNGPHTQIPVDDKLKITLFLDDTSGGNGGTTPATHAVIDKVANDGGDPPIHINVPIPVNLPPVTFAPLSLTATEDTPLVFGGSKAISVVDNDSSTVTVTLSVTNGVLSLASVAGLSFIAGGGTGHATMTFSGSPAAIAAALNGLTYTPAQDYNGPATLSVSAGDGNSTPLTTTVTLNVTAVNDAPVLGDALSTPVAYAENDCATVVNATLTISDVDSATLSGATVKIVGNFACGEDVLSFTSHGGITGTYDAQTGILTLSGEASLADYQAVLRSVTYENTSSDPSDAPRTIEFQVNDGSSEHAASNVVSTTVEVSPANNAPVLTLVGHVADQFDSQAYDLNSGTANWTSDWIENGDYANSPTTGEIQVKTDPSASEAGFRLFLSDDDSESGAADTIERSANLSGASSATLTFDYRRQIEFGDPDDVVKVWASTDGVNFTLVGQIGADGYGTYIDEGYQQFTVDISGYISPTTTIRFSIDDGVDNGDEFYIDNVKIEYDATPTYVEGGSAVSIAPGGASIKDDDNTTLQSATITLTNAQAGDLLSVCGQLPGGIVASNYDAQTGVLTLTGEASLADYQAALAQIQFSNTGDNPGSCDRTIEIVVSDGSASSNTGTVTVHVTPVNDAPESPDSANPATFTEDTDTVIPFSALLANASDPEGDTLSIVNVATSSANGGTVTVNGTDITYHPAANFTGSDYFLYSVTDGNGGTIQRAATFTVAAVNDAPTVDLNGANPGGNYSTTALSYSTTQLALAGAVAALGADVAIADVDNTAIQSASLLFSFNDGREYYTTYAADDVFVDTGLLTGFTGTAHGGSWHGLQWQYMGGSNGIRLDIEGAGSAADYQQLLEAVRFSTTSTDYADRIATLTVNDGTDDSQAVTSTIHVQSANDNVTMTATAWAGAGTIDLGSGTDTVNVWADADISALGTPTVVNVESGNLIGTGGTDTITLTGLQLDNIIIGSGTINLGAGSGDTINLKSTSADLNTLGATDASIVGVEAISAAGAGAGVSIDVHGQSEGFTISGSANADTLIGGSGNDTINGGNGADIIIGGAGADNVTGGLGADVFHISSVDGDTINGTAENGTLDVLMLDAAGTYDLRGPGSALLPATPVTITNIDVISFNVDAAGFSINLGGASGGLFASADANGDGTKGDLNINAAVVMTNGVTIATAGLSGNRGIHVDGTNLGGNDTITGNGGIDVIDGGRGDDILKGDASGGGNSSDTFVFNANFGHDTVVDFAAGTDFLQFDHTVFADVAAVLAATADVSGHAVITYDGSNTVTLNIDTATLTLHQTDIHIV